MMTNLVGCWNSIVVGLTLTASLGYAGSLLVDTLRPYFLASVFLISLSLTLWMKASRLADLRICSTLTCNLLDICLIMRMHY